MGNHFFKSRKENAPKKGKVVITQFRSPRTCKGRSKTKMEVQSSTFFPPPILEHNFPRFGTTSIDDVVYARSNDSEP